MKKFFVCFMLFFGSINSFFSESIVRKAVNKDIFKNNYSIICREENVTLVSDKNGKFFIYWEGYNFAAFYEEFEKIEKSYVALILRDFPSSVWKVQSKGYTIFYYKNSYYYNGVFFVRTPKDNFYILKEKINGEIRPDDDSIIDNF